MNTPARLLTYGAVLALVAGGGWAVGATVGSGDVDTVVAREGAEKSAQPGGLASSEGGYAFVPARTTLASGPAEQFSFRIIGPDGAPVTDFAVEHEKRLHLIVVRRDTASFQHVHPELAADGTWTTPLRLERPGSYRAFADFVPAGGDGMTLGVDLAVPGDFRPTPFGPSRTAEVDGYQVRLLGDLVPGKSSKVTLSVTTDGRPVTDLEPYLGAYGHLVALRGGDLAYLHVHPDGEPDDGKTRPGPEVTFYAEVPSAGNYRLFLDFKHGGTVRTAEFSVDAAAAAPAPVATPDKPDNGDGHAGHG